MKTTTSGILLIDKSAGMTSRHLGNVISKQLGIKKVGHLGTLDPFATGLLIIALGEGTKVLPFLEDDRKTYVATLKFGLLTSTLDPEGEVLQEETVPAFTMPQINEVLTTFLGEIVQVPPLTSAIKVDGKRMYEYAHAGLDFDVPARNVMIYNIRIVDYIHPFLSLEIEVGKGTYIRTLLNDIAKKLGTVATTISLRRTKQSGYEVTSAVSLEELTSDDIISVSDALHMFPIVKGDDRVVRQINNGQEVSLNARGDIIQLHDEYGVLVALCRQNDGRYRSIRGFNL